MIDRQVSGSPRGSQISPQLIMGLIIIFVGIVFTLDELGIAPASSYLRYWPMALVAIGVIKLLQAQEGSGAFVGLIFTVVGVWLQAEELDLIQISFRNVWPLALVLFGGYLVWQGLQPRRSAPPQPTAPEIDPFGPLPPLDLDSDTRAWTSGADTVDPGRSDAGTAGAGRRESNRERGCARRRSGDSAPRITDTNSTMSAVAILGAVTRGNNSRAFRAANLLAFMGGCEIDLRKAAINGEAIIDVFAMWGGIEIRVPEDWTVSSQVVPLMGGVEDKTRPPQGATAHRLTLRGLAFMGGIEIRN
jgi:hypothetical protein